METYYDYSRESPVPRLFPYVAATSEQSGFVDFIKYPELIETVLEDFIPFSHADAVRTFYKFLRWINGPNSNLATNDCVLRSPSPHRDAHSHFDLSVCGRVGIHYRNLHLNSSNTRSNLLCQKLMEYLSSIDKAFTPAEGLVGFSKNPVIQTAISNGGFCPDGSFEEGFNDPGFGTHLMLTFWAYGGTEKSAFSNLERVFNNIWEACRLASKDSK